MGRFVSGVRRGVLLGAVLVTIIGVVGYPALAAAQDQQQTQEQQAQQPQYKEEVEVTGSLIPRPTLEAMSPVATLDPQQISNSGITRLEDLLTSLPQVFSAQNSTIANGATGTATVDLRYLGPNRTLVLIDGKRMPPGDVFAVSGDLNFVPAFLVKRVDILTGGASSVYGADAVAGVVNFVMDRDFEGFRGGIQYSGYQHNNNNSTAERIQKAAGYKSPTGSVWDGGALDAYVAWGGKFANGKGHATAYVEYRQTSALKKNRRDYTNCSVSGLSLSCGGSWTSPTGDFFTYDEQDWTLDTSGPGNTLRPFIVPNDLFNFGAVNFMQRPDERWTAGAFVDYQWNEHLHGYLDVMLMDDTTDAQIAPSGDFYVTNYVNCNNPLLSADELEKFGCNDPSVVYTDPATGLPSVPLQIGRRNVEGGPRSDHLEHTAYRLVAGLKGDLGKDWGFDFYGLHAQTRAPEIYNNDLNSQRLQDSLLVISDPDTGEPVCASGNVGCVPWDIFNAGGVTQAAIDYLKLPLLSNSRVRTDVVSAKVNGDLGAYGVKFPSATEGLKVAFGAEYRKERLVFQPDFAYQQGWGAGQGGSTLPVHGDYSVKEGYAELLVPVVQDVKGAQNLSLELGYRYSDYSTTGSANTWKAQLSYAPVNGYKFRAGHSRATRSPNVVELFRPQTVLLYGSDDPCAGASPAYTQEQCANTGVTADQYGHVRLNQAGQYNALLGGNPNLQPEIGDTDYFGIVITPPGLPGFTAALDYFKIKIKDTIGTLYPDDVINQCAVTGDPTLCSLIHRDQFGTLWLTPQGYTVATNLNIGELGSEGVDVNASYLMPMGNSFLNFALMGTYLIHENVNTGLYAYDCVGLYGNSCHIPQPHWRHRFQVSWETGKATLTLGWRMQGSVKVDASSHQEALYNPSRAEQYKAVGSYENSAYNYFDLSGTYNLTKNIQFTAGVNNVLDKEPPLGVGFQDNDYGPGFYGFYDPYGRFLHSALIFTF